MARAIKESAKRGHLFITVLAYRFVQFIRTQLKAHGIHDSWTSLRATLREQHRVTAAFTQRDGRTLNVRNALQDAGVTQEDALADCKEAYDEAEGKRLGFCFYTRQDLNRAKRTSHLPLGFWGAPDGAPDAMLAVARLVVNSFRENGFIVDWNDSPCTRPTVYLQGIGQSCGKR